MLAFGDYAAADLVRDYGLTDLGDRARESDAATGTWTLAEVRRVYRPASIKDPVTGSSIRGHDGRTIKDPTRKGETWRSLRACTTCKTHDEGVASLHRIAEQHDASVVTGTDGVPRLTVRAMPTAAHRWPITTHQFVLVPGQVAEKQRLSFEEEWNHARHEEDSRGGQEIPFSLDF